MGRRITARLGWAYRQQDGKTRGLAGHGMHASLLEALCLLARQEPFLRHRKRITAGAGQLPYAESRVGETKASGVLFLAELSG